MPSFGSKQHSRSLSHPFPSIFGGGKKPRPNGDSNGDYIGDADPYAQHTPYADHVPARGHPAASRREEVTSTCMTCDSKVRYPRGLTTFRCSACLMVNDLVPIRQDRPDRNPSTQPSTGPPRRPMPLTVDRAKHIIDRCLETYLHNLVERRSRSSQESVERPRGSQDSEGPPRISTDGPRSGEGGEREASRDGRLAPMPIRPRALSAGRPMISVSPPSAVEKSNGFSSPKGGKSPPMPIGPRGPPTPDEILAPPPTLRHPPRPGTAPSPPNRRPPPPPVHPPPPPPPGVPVSHAGRGSPRDIPPHAGSLPPHGAPPLSPTEIAERRRYEQVKMIFRPLEDYLIASYGNFDYLNVAFMLGRPRHTPRTRSEGAMTREQPSARPQAPAPAADADFLEADARMLMIGDIGENASWWPGRPEKESPQQSSTSGKPSTDTIIVNHKSPLINWTEAQHWYDAVNGAGVNWRERLEEMPNLDFPEELVREADEEIRDARVHVQRTLLKVTENLLKRPGRPLEDPEDLRWLLIILYNPMLHGSIGQRSPSLRPPPQNRPRQGSNPNQPPLGPPLGRPPANRALSPGPKRSASNANREPGQHSGIIKRVLGLLSNLDNECHRYLTTWFSRFSEDHFRRMVDLVGKFVTYRLTRQPRKRSNSGNPTAGLIPEFGSNGATSAQLHAALGLSGSGPKPDDRTGETSYSDDWQVRAAAKVMALLFAANNTYHNRKTDPVNTAPSQGGQPSAGLAARERARAHGQLLPTSDFYNTLLDFHDLIADFEAWEKRTAKFSFCQYPFFLSIGAKIKIMEHDARRQMENKAREAFFDSILSNRNLEQYFNLRVRRECLVEDSLRRISEVVGGGGEEIKKGLRVHFVGEEGVDAGGLRKEWFLMLVRELFDPNHGMFVYDEDSQFCYFNPNTFEQSDQFFLVGAVLGLALYNSTILDVALPPFAFKKLLASAPTKNGVAPASRNRIDYTLDDLAEFRPRLAKGLRQLLEFEGDVESTFCRDFVAEVERYGVVYQVPLCKDGANRPVTNANRKEFVDLYVRYFLDTAVARQFDPFRRGFFTVCGGNALSLFRSEEIELMVRGSDEPLDVASVRAVAVYEGWSDPAHGSRKVDRPGEQILVLRWFWEFFENASPADQRKILSFITGSDRIPAVGATNLVIKIGCLGDDCDRFPVARTCFNMLQLYKYKSRQKLIDKLWRAVLESEGFGLK